MRPVVTLALGLSLMVPAAAMADCPGPGDLARGITLVYDDGPETYREIRPGLVGVVGFNDETGYFTMRLGQGFHLLDTRDVGDPDGAQTYDYGMPEDALPVPVSGETRIFHTLLTNADGTFEQLQTHSYGKTVPVDIGPCRYSAFEAQILYETEDNYTEGVLYLPELGFGYLHWIESDTDPREMYTALEIRTGR